MTTEFVLILCLYAFILLGALMGERGPIGTFKSSGPRFAAKIEKDIAIGYKFTDQSTKTSVRWLDPKDLKEN